MAKIRVRPVLVWARMVSQKSLRDSGSIPVVGSSKISICGAATRAMASFTRWRSPPESLTTLRLRSSVRFTRSMTCMTSRRPRWLRVAIISMLLCTSTSPSRALVCSTALIFAFLAASFTPVPSTLMVPLVGWFSPSTMSSRVVLPAPFSPSRATTWPVGISRLTPSTACTLPKYLVTCFTSRACVALALAP